MARQRYRSRLGRAVVAVQLKLDMPGFRYRKWGHEQQCRAGDWLLDNGGDVYTVDGEVFARTYRAVGPSAPGQYVKHTQVWAEQATAPGAMPTKEGHTDYRPGDWLVSNQEDGGDTYAIGADKFGSLYEPDV